MNSTAEIRIVTEESNGFLFNRKERKLTELLWIPIEKAN